MRGCPVCRAVPDTHRACARVTQTRHRGTAGLCLEMGNESQACSRRMKSLGKKFLNERRLGWEVCPLNLPRPLLIFEVFLSCLPLPVCTGMPPRDTVGTAALPCRLEAVLRQSITNSGQCCTQTPVPIPQPHVSSLSPFLSTSCQHCARCSPLQLQPSAQGARERFRAQCTCRDIAWLGSVRVYTATPSPRPSGATAAPSSAPSPCPSRRVGTKHPAPASKYHAVTTVIWYCAGAGALPALLPRLPTSCSTQAATRAPWPASCPEILSPAGTREPEAPGRGRLAAPARRERAGGSLITARGERRDCMEHPPPARAPPLPAPISHPILK